MIIYKDVINGDELFSDCYKVKEEDAFFVFPGKYVSRKEGQISDSLFGGNASAEDAQEEVECATQCGQDFALNGRLEEYQFCDRSDLKRVLKEYMAGLEAKLHGGKDKGCDEVKEFRKRARDFVAKLMEFHKDLVAFYGETDEEKKGTCCFARYLEDGMSTEVYVFKDGIECEKC